MIIISKKINKCRNFNLSRNRSRSKKVLEQAGVMHSIKQQLRFISLLCISYQSVLLWFNIVHYSSLFQYFFWFTLVENFYFLNVLLDIK